MPRPSLRDKIINSGVETLRRSGFAGSGVREITREAGVPQGCFTNHFRSKEAFGGVALEQYRARVEAIMAETLGNAELTPMQRLRAYFEAISARLEAEGWRFGCLIGNMSIEVAEGSEALRHQLSTIHATHSATFAEPIRAGQACGEIRQDLAAEDIAAFLVTAWHGAMMRMKVDRDSTPLEQFKRTAFAVIAA